MDVRVSRLLALSLSCLVLLAAPVIAQKKGGGHGPGGDIHVLLPETAYAGGLITGVVLGDDDQPVPNAPVTLTGGYPALASGELTGEVIGDDGDKTAMKTPGPPQTERKAGGDPRTADNLKPKGVVGPVDTPQSCARLIQQAQGIVAGNQGSDHILIGLLLPAVQKIREAAGAPVQADATMRPANEVREAANAPNAAGPGGGPHTTSAGIIGPVDNTAIVSPRDTRAGGQTWLKANGGGIFTDANGRFSFCATPDAREVQVGMGDGSVRSLTLNGMPGNGTPDNGCPDNGMPDNGASPNALSNSPLFFAQPSADVSFSKLMTNAVVVQGGKQWRLPMARAYSPSGQCVSTSLRMPRDLGPGTAQLSFFDDQGRQRTFTGGVFKIVGAALDRDKLRSHQEADFRYELAFTGFGPEYGQGQFGPEYGRNLCVNVSTQGPVVLTSPALQQLEVNGDGHATVSGKVRATQVAPGSTVPFGIKLHVLDCATGHHTQASNLVEKAHENAAGLTASARRWMEDKARELSGNLPSALGYGDISRMVRTRFPSANDQGIEYLMSLMMALAARDAHEDLKLLAADLEELNRKKQAMRDAMTRIESERREANERRRATGPNSAVPCATPGCRALVGDLAQLLPGSVKKGRSLTYGDLNRFAGDLERKKDSLDEIGEDVSTKIRMQQNRRSKLEEMLSEMMKKSSDTDASLVANLK